MGGNVEFIVDGEPMRGGRIHQYDITDTLKFVSKITDISFEKLYKNILGSAYKQESSGDIDIALDGNEIGFEELRDHLKTSYDFVNSLNGLNIINLLVPIQGKHSERILPADDYNGYVQVDLMIGNPDWMKFSYWSSGKKSKYKGKYRTMLLMCVALTKTEFLDVDTQGEVLAKIGAIFDLNKGIVMQKRIRRKNKNGFAKNLSKVDIGDEEWKERYGELEITNQDITSPNDAAEFLFGKGTTIKDLQTFERVVKLVRQMPKEEQYKIDKLFHMKAGRFIDEVEMM